MKERDEVQLFSFESGFVPVPPGTSATPRPSDRPREMSMGDFAEPKLFAFECEAEILPPGTPATPRPLDRPRELETPDDTDVVAKLAGPVLEYVRANPSGTVEELAALMRQLLARRSA